jgi:hypothetical protein
LGRYGNSFLNGENKMSKLGKRLIKSVKNTRNPVHHPSHYGGADNPYEAIKVLEARMTREEVIGYLKATVYTYNDRAKYKGNELEDYEKAAWFQNRLVTFMKGK